MLPDAYPHYRVATRRAVWSRGAFSWYVGAGISLIWLVSVGQAVVVAAPTAAQAAVGLVGGGLLALSFTLYPWLGWEIVGTWTYVGVTVAMSVVSWGITWTLIAGLGVAALLAKASVEGWSEDIFWLPIIIVTISLMMAGFGRTMAAMNQLRATQRQLEELAVERERGRMARDIHDILGHSLTVVTVKAELAGRLVDVDPARAKAEIAEVEELARGALADVRATVAGSRSVNVSGEIAAARAALTAAGIEPRLPNSTDTIAPHRRELAGWIVREGVTNVVRHSGASVCRVRLAPHEVEVADDGVGPVAASAASTGLGGLRERVEAAGGRMTVGRSDLGGFSLRVAM